MSRRIVGKIVAPVNPYLKPHEWETINFLLQHGYDIETITESRICGTHTPDIKMLGKSWEIKSPTGNSARTIENIVRVASVQSHYIIIDLRRTKRQDAQCVREIKARFEHVKSLQEIMIITKTQRMIHIKRNK